MNFKKKRSKCETFIKKYLINLGFIFSNPIFKGTSFVNATNIPNATASRLLNALGEGGILIPVREKTGRAGQKYCFDRLHRNRSEQHTS